MKLYVPIFKKKVFPNNIYSKVVIILEHKSSIFHTTNLKKMIKCQKKKDINTKMSLKCWRKSIRFMRESGKKKNTIEPTNNCLGITIRKWTERRARKKASRRVLKNNLKKNKKITQLRKKCQENLPGEDKSNPTDLNTIKSEINLPSTDPTRSKSKFPNPSKSKDHPKSS